MEDAEFRRGEELSSLTPGAQLPPELSSRGNHQCLGLDSVQELLLLDACPLPFLEAVLVDEFVQPRFRPVDLQRFHARPTSLLFGPLGDVADPARGGHKNIMNGFGHQGYRCTHVLRDALSAPNGVQIHKLFALFAVIAHLRQGIRAYPPATVIAEKFQAMVALGVANGRMKDYFDLWAIPKALPIVDADLDAAIRATFARRGTGIPRDRPPGLSEAFTGDEAKQRQWRAYARSIDLEGVTLEEVVEAVWALVGPSCARIGSPSR